MSVEFATFEDMLTSVQGLPAMPTAVIDADERHVLEGACEAAAAGYIEPILIGDEKSIRNILTSRSDPPRARLISCAVAALVSHRME
jgi:phosphotransacetylase